MKQESADLRREAADFQKQRPAMQAAVQALQKQIEHLQGGVQQRSDLIAQYEKRLNEAIVQVADVGARRAGLEERAKELQSQLREHAKRVATAKLEEGQAQTETIRTQEQAKQLDSQQKEIAHPAQAGEQLEKQVADIEQELSDKQKEFAPVVGDVAALDAQPSELSHQGLPKRVPIPPPRPTDLGR